jgi:hypothetical protein
MNTRVSEVSSPACLPAALNLLSPSDTAIREPPGGSLVVHRDVSRRDERRQKLLRDVHDLPRPACIVHTKVPSSHQSIVSFHAPIVLRATDRTTNNA